MKRINLLLLLLLPVIAALAQQSQQPDTSMRYYAGYIREREYEDSILQKIMGKEEFVYADLLALPPLPEKEEQIKKKYIEMLPLLRGTMTNKRALQIHYDNFKSEQLKRTARNLPRNKPPSNWHTLDVEKDSVYGISVEKAYRELLAGKKPDTVIVAVIDGGVNTQHEDLLPVLWRNTREDGTDADHNGYMGDSNGWNFLGGKNGVNIDREAYEFKRVFLQLKDKYQNTALKKTAKKNKAEYELWLQVYKDFQQDSARRVSGYLEFTGNLKKEESELRKMMGKELYTLEELKAFEPSTPEQKKLKTRFVHEFNRDSVKTNGQLIDKYNQQAFEKYVASLSEGDPVRKRKQVTGDDYTDINDRYYGNGNVMAGSVTGHTLNHGTHVAGIIGAARGNGMGMDGIAGAVKIMAIRAVPDGDEYDKDIALAIRYAVDNGAKVINMSFAKTYSPNRQWVEDAIKYAAKKNVLLVNGAGNDGKNIDSFPMYPTAKYISSGKSAPNMITVGASSSAKEQLIAGFSNYGQAVNVFAPGMGIYSSISGNYKGEKYGNMSGTSMASPVVAGLAALLRSYYPRLSAKQVKYIVEASVLKIDFPVNKPGSQEKVAMSTLCETGGIVNAYAAVQLAEKLSR